MGSRIRFLSANPGKRAAEKFCLAYAPVWAAASAVVMLSGAAERWGDVEFMAYGLGLWLPVAVVPLIWRSAEDRGKPLHRLHATKMHACLFLLAMSGSYNTSYFYDVLHMHYGFATTWNVNNVPLFLYALTVAYFSTYFVLLACGYRFLRSLLPPGAPPVAAGLMVVPVSLLVALLETLTHATPAMARLFCYDDVPFMLTFGTVMYATWFVITVPLWFVIDEEPGRETPWSYVLLSTLAACTLILATSELFKWVIAPHFTTVVDHAPGLRDFGTSCLGDATRPPRCVKIKSI
jgi:cycloeucalenol cycloisomerase